ncbi:MAG: hypothetical protein FWD61_03395 [Phycisphaerales bacterium]|nr:hypothetical protein [Phycisphaerales bacterium]
MSTTEPNALYITEIIITPVLSITACDIESPRITDSQNEAAEAVEQKEETPPTKQKKHKKRTAIY